MKTIKINSLIVASLFCTALNAQEKIETTKENQKLETQVVKQSPEAKAQEQTERLNRLLKLDENQKASILQINTNFNLRLEAIHSNTNMSEQDKKSTNAMTETKRNEDIRAVLTPEQIKKFDGRKEATNAN